MKLASFRRADGAGVGLVHDNDRKLFDLQRASQQSGAVNPAFGAMLGVIDAGAAALDQARWLFERFGHEPEFSTPVDKTDLLAPLPEPRQMRDFMVFETHIIQANLGFQRMLARQRGDEQAARDAQPMTEIPAVYRHHPTNYLTNRFSVVGHRAAVRWPLYSHVMDYELEFAIVTGKQGRDIPEDRAHEYIFGFTIFNDFSARDTQTTEMPSLMGPGKAKSFDTGNALGPWIVTADEIEDPYALSMTARVNGETWSSGSTAGMMYTFEQMIAHASKDETLQAGEVFGSGTVGNGCGLELGRFLKHKDIVELEIEMIGVLQNTIVRQDGE